MVSPPPAGIRPARPADAAEIARIQLARWASAYRGLVPAAVLAELAGQQDRIREHWAVSLARPPTSRHRVLSAVAAGPDGARLVAGFASFGPAGDPGLWAGTDAELYALCVDPAQAGHGHGSRLLNAAAAAMADDGFGTAYAWLLEGDAPAFAFLSSAGWAPDGARRELDMGVPVPTLRLHAAVRPAEPPR